MTESKGFDFEIYNEKDPLRVMSAIKEELRNWADNPPMHIHSDFAFKEKTVSDVEETESSFKVVANPRARHDMHWSNYGDGYCSEMIKRPNGKTEPCGETQDHVIHGGPRYLDLPHVEDIVYKGED